jgi:hypothetical protein
VATDGGSGTTVSPADISPYWPATSELTVGASVKPLLPTPLATTMASTFALGQAATSNVWPVFGEEHSAKWELGTPSTGVLKSGDLPTAEAQAFNAAALAPTMS